MSENVRYQSQTVDYLGFLQTQLRDLRGISTLAYELIQNADDVHDEDGRPAADRITFNICDDALIVENDGIFREVDFERISHIASGGKREERGTTGAFGIGFISVYQVTDSPEIFSSGQHWRIRPDVADEGKRIEIRDGQVKGTRFRLPWAFDPRSAVRQKLRIEAINRSQFDEFQREIAQALSFAALFLKQLRVLELKRSGKTVKRVERVPEEEDQLLIQDGNQTFIWQIFRGNFDAEASRLRHQYPSHIEDKRRSEVLIAIPDEPLTSGRLFAILPTETIVPLPFHLNADFFPSSDRKHIIFGSDYQAEWNRAAVRAAAHTLAANFDKLRDLLGHKGIWLVLQRLAECSRQVGQDEYDPVFAAFWEKITPDLSTRPIVFTTTRHWVTPDKARLLESDAEEAAASILESLHIPIVHPDLRPYFGLLRQKEVGTPLVKMADIVEALGAAGLGGGTPLSRAPVVLSTVEQWQTFWHALDTMLERRQQTKDEKDQAKKRLRECAIAFSSDKVLWPPTQLCRGDAATQALFPELRWLAETHEPDKVPYCLVEEFTAEQAIDFLNQKSKEQLETAWRHGQWNVATLYTWFEARKAEILPHLQLKQKLRSLPIWPTADQLGALSGLYIAGGFEDPLKLSDLVDLKALGGRREFLKDLGVQELTFATYVKEQVPRVFKEQPDLPSTARRQLIQLIARRMGEIQGHQALKDCLSRLPLVECTDNVFRPANQVYAHENVTATLGSHISVAKAITENTDAINALYTWLGVAQHPRPSDIFSRLRESISKPPDKAAHQVVEAIFAYLAEQWSTWDTIKQNQYSALKEMTWLPSDKDARRWYRPDKLYASFLSYLFETQAHFLKISRTLQSRASATGFIDFLNIETTPMPLLVVRHLKECSQHGRPVNKEVYRFLNDHAGDPALAELHETACLLLPNNQYVRPDQVFWSEHPFGQFRYQLGTELRPYSVLFERLGVREHPEDQDCLKVLGEISAQYQQTHAPLDDQTYTIIIHCWEGLSVALELGRLNADDLTALKEELVIPNIQRLLTKPEDIFFEDRAGMAAKFPQFLENNVIVRPQGAWRAMQEAGVRLLGDAVELHVIERDGAVADTRLAALVRERRKLLDRVIESEKSPSTDGLDRAILDQLHFQRVERLLINYSLRAFKQRRTTEPESAPALFLRDEAALLIVYELNSVPWSAVAREMAIAIKPIGEIGGLAGGIKEVLASASSEVANRSLDELGYPPLQQQLDISVVYTGPISGLGGDELSLEDLDRDRTEMPEASSETISSAGSAGGNSTDQAQAGGIHQPTPGGTGHGGTTDATSGEVKGSKKREPTGRLRTYVTSNGNETQGEPDTQAAHHRSTVAQAGVARVLEYEAAHNREAVDTNENHPNHPGYDVESADAAGNMRYIEVKAMQGDWSPQSPAAVTKTQYEKARDLGDQFWLYVVAFATHDEEYQIYPIQNPAHRVSEYLFDDGWQELAETQ